MLRPPVGQDMPASAMAPAMAGGFNPMDNGTIQLRAPSRLATNGYLPDSRYTSRRNGGNAAPFSRVQ